MMKMMETSQIKSVLSMLCVLGMLGVMQTSYVYTYTLKAERLLTRRSQTSQILGQQLELRHGDRTVGWSRRWRGSTPSVATYPDPNGRGKHAFWNYRIQRLIDLLLQFQTFSNRNRGTFRITIASLIQVNYLLDVIIHRICTNCELFLGNNEKSVIIFVGNLYIEFFSKNNRIVMKVKI